MTDQTLPLKGTAPMTDIDRIIAGLTKAQRGAVLAFSDEDRAFE